MSKLVYACVVMQTQVSAPSLDLQPPHAGGTGRSSSTRSQSGKSM